jgi:two-component sensor histidine kinase
MEQSLKEKEVLLKEVHHRVKNNMQVISSILNLQSSYVSDDYALSLLKESQNRIKTMAYIHESLYQNKSFTSVNFSDYIATLSHNIIQSYSVSEEKVKLILNLEKINLNLDNSIPTGLIVNELITNAIKHAFPSAAKGFISVNLKSKNNTVYLEVKDNGIGFDSNIDFRNTNSLGLQLVSTLIDQIEGDIEFKSEKDKGTEVLITFKM